MDYATNGRLTMSELTPKLPPTLQNALETYYALPAPSAEFASRLEMQLRREMKQTLAKRETSERNSFMTLLRTRPIMAVLVVLIVLLALTGVAYAIGLSLGYVPGIGLVNQDSDATLRMLESPIQIRRDNIDLQIEQVMVATDKTIIVYKYVILDAANLSMVQPESDTRPSLTLPDGSRLETRLGRRLSGDGPAGDDYPVRYLLEFSPLPQDVLAVTLEIPSLPFSYENGPRDWQIPLKLMFAPEGTILPVYDVGGMEGGNADSTSSSPNVPSAGMSMLHGITATLDMYVPLDSGYLLIGSMQWSAQDYPARAVQPLVFDMHMTDATGREVAFEPVIGSVPEKPQDEDFRSYWVLKVLEKDFTAPLNIRINTASVNIQPPLVFNFDPGSSPAPDLNWDIDQDLQFSDIKAHISSVTLTISESSWVFEFLIQTQPDQLADVYINMDIAQCMGGGGGIPAEPSETILSSVYTCLTDLPSGPLEVNVTGALIWGPWQMEWMPPPPSAGTLP
jgi:hypothetical protein